jgi:hypothetical protein
MCEPPAATVFGTFQTGSPELFAWTGLELRPALNYDLPDLCLLNS